MLPDLFARDRERLARLALDVVLNWFEDLKRLGPIGGKR